MEIAGLGVGIAGIAGLFTTCLDVVERIDSYRDYGVDSRAIISQFDANVLLFRQWGNAVGIQGRRLKEDHNPRLDDEAALSAVRNILLSIQDMVGTRDGAFSGQDNSEGLASSERMPQDSQMSLIDKFRGAPSHKKKMAWTLRHRARFFALAEQFGNLIGTLRDLVPPDTSETTDPVPQQPTQPIRIERNSLNAASQQLLMKIEKQIERDIRNDINAWLSPSSTIALFHKAIGDRLTGTCDWVLSRNVLCDWMSPEFTSDRAKVLWIKGPAGYGKTVLCARLVQFFQSQDFSNLASFFFSADLEDRADPFVIARSWISQIMSQSTEAYNLAHVRMDLEQGPVASPPEIMGLFREIVENVPGCTFVVDGLDECSTQNTSFTPQGNKLEQFMRMIVQAIASTKSRLLVVSRDDKDIRSGLSGGAGVELHEYEITRDDATPDATKLSQSIVDCNLRDKNFKVETFKADLVQRMVDHCDAMLWRINLLGNHIRAGKSPRQLERIVDQTPTELSTIYDRNWAKIMDQGIDTARALAILRWATFGLRPLTVSEMTEAVLLTELEDVDDFENELPDEFDEDFLRTEILELCASMLEARTAGTASADDVGSRTLHFRHFTMREYVLLHLPVSTSQLVANSALLSQDDSAQHNTLAVGCLRYLTTPGWQHEAPGEARCTKRSFQRYAMDSWHRHRQPDKTNYDAVRELTASFFREKDNQWEDWRRHYEASLGDNKMLRYDAAIKSASRLFYAALFGLDSEVKEMVDRRSLDVNHVDESGRTGLLAAVYNRHRELVEYLLARNAEVDKASTRGCTPLLAASSLGDKETAVALITAGADPNLADEAGVTPLSFTSYRGHLEVLTMLLAKGANLNLANHDNVTPLFAASMNGHSELVKKLLEEGADWTIAAKNMHTPLMVAAQYGHAEAVKALLKRGAHLDVPNKVNVTPLFRASCIGHLAVVKILLEEVPDVNVASLHQDTPLMGAAQFGHAEIAKTLLENGADLNAANVNGQTSLYKASRYGKIEVVKTLLQWGADLNTAENRGWTPIMLASNEGHLELTKILLQGGADLNTANNEGRTPLCLASFFGHVEVANLLLEHEADITVVDKFGSTPLSSASQEGHLEMVKVLLEKGANPNVADNDGCTPLFPATRNGYVEVAKILLEHEADMTIVSNTGLTPLHAASEEGYLEIVKILIVYGADVNSVGKIGSTPLQVASGNGHLGVVKLLLEKGANPNVAGKDGQTPLSLASCNGHLEIARVLRDNGAG